MKRAIPAFVLLSLVPAAGVADLPAFHGNARHTGYSAAHGPANPLLRWKLDLSGAVISSPVLGSDGTVYLGAVLRDTRHPEHFITAVRPDGTVKWRFTTGWWDDQTQSSPALGPDGTVYVGAQDGFLYALHPDGSLAWRYAAGAPVQQHPVVAADGTVYVGLGGQLHAFTGTGTLKWTAPLGYDLPGGPALSPDGNTIYEFGYTTEGPASTLYAFHTDGSLKWRFDGFYAYYPALSPPTVAADGTVLVLSGQIVAIAPDGTERWRYAPSAAFYNSYASLSVDPAGDVVFAFDWYVGKLTPSGAPIWQQEFLGGPFDNELESTYSSPLIDADGRIYLGLGTGKRWTRPWGKVIRGYGPSGSLLWEFPVGEGVYSSSPALAPDGTLYVGSMDGFLYALNDVPVPPNAITSLTLDPPQVPAGMPSRGTVTLRGPAGAGGATVVLASKNTAAAEVPPSVLVPAGATSAGFDVLTHASSPVASVAIVGQYGNATQFAILTLNGIVTPGPRLTRPSAPLKNSGR